MVTDTLFCKSWSRRSIYCCFLERFKMEGKKPPMVASSSNVPGTSQSLARRVLCHEHNILDRVMRFKVWEFGTAASR